MNEVVSFAGFVVNSTIVAVDRELPAGSFSSPPISGILGLAHDANACKYELQNVEFALSRSFLVSFPSCGLDRQTCLTLVVGCVFVVCLLLLLMLLGSMLCLFRPSGFAVV